MTLVTQYDVELLQRIEQVIGKKMDLWPSEPEEIALLKERVNDASRLAVTELKDQDGKARDGGRKRKHGNERRGDDNDRDDDEVEAGMPRRRKYKK